MNANRIGKGLQRVRSPSFSRERMLRDRSLGYSIGNLYVKGNLLPSRCTPTNAPLSFATVLSTPTLDGGVFPVLSHAKISISRQIREVEGGRGSDESTSVATFTVEVKDDEISLPPPPAARNLIACSERRSGG